jgi:hypothetical protein
MLSRIWAEQKRFILVVGGGFAIFLFLNALAGGCIQRADGPNGLIAQAGKREREVRALHKELKDRYWDEKSRLEGFEKEEAALRADLELPPEAEIATLDEAAPINQFNRAIDKVWGEATRTANRAAIALPEKLGPEDFGISSDDGKREYEQHYAYLGVIRRALRTLVESGMTEIGRPELVDAELVPVIPGNEIIQCIYVGVIIKVAGPYDAFLRALKGVQGAKDFLQVRIEEIAQKSANEERIVRGELQFLSFRLAEGADLEAPDEKKRPARKTGRRKAR